MNNVTLIGRLTKDPEVRYTADQMAIAKFTVAVDRFGKEKQADFIPVTVFGKQAENCEKYLVKGRKVAIQGRIQTGSYENKEGKRVYTTDVVANTVEFVEWGDRDGLPARAGENSIAKSKDGVPEGFQSIDDDDIPF